MNHGNSLVDLTTGHNDSWTIEHELLRCNDNKENDDNIAIVDNSNSSNTIVVRDPFD